MLTFLNVVQKVCLNPVKENYLNLSSDEKKRIKNNYTHTDFYEEEDSRPMFVSYRG